MMNYVCLWGLGGGAGFLSGMRGRFYYLNFLQILSLFFFSLMYFCLVSARFVRGECGGKFFCCCLKKKKDFNWIISMLIDLNNLLHWGSTRKCKAYLSRWTVESQLAFMTEYPALFLLFCSWWFYRLQSCFFFCTQSLHCKILSNLLRGMLTIISCPIEYMGT